MPFYKVANTSVVRIDDATGGVRVLTAFIDTMSVIGKSVAQLDVTSFADAAERIIAGIEQSGEVTFSGPWSDSATGQDAYLPALVGTIQTVDVGVAGTASGARRIQGEFLCVSYQVEGAVKGNVRWTSRHKLDGTLAHTGTF